MNIEHPQANTEETCINCNKPVAEDYCVHCGQRNGVPRLRFKELVHEAFGKMIGLDTRFLRTIVDLTLRPIKVLDAVLNGNRVRYLGPVTYYFLVWTIYLLTAKLLGISMAEIADFEGGNGSLNINLDDTDEGEVMRKKFMDFFFSYMQFLTMFMFPFLALWGMLFFRKRGLNFIEHVVFCFYASAHPYWIGILNFFVYKFTGNMHVWVNMLPSLIYFVWLGQALYRPRNRWLGGFKVFTVMILGYLSYMLAFLILTIIAMVIYAIFLKID